MIIIEHSSEDRFDSIFEDVTCDTSQNFYKFYEASINNIKIQVFLGIAAEFIELKVNSKYYDEREAYKKTIIHPDEASTKQLAVKIYEMLDHEVDLSRIVRKLNFEKLY